MIVLDQVTLGYRGRPVVRGLSGRILPGSLTAVTGCNGAGKSTLLKAIAGLVTPLAGHISMLPPFRRGQIGWLPQDAGIDRSFPITLLDMVLMGHWSRVGAFGRVTRNLHNQALGALAMVGLQGAERLLIGEVSRGQFQRMLFARLIVQDATLLLMDEPFTAMDVTTTAALMGLVTHWHEAGRTIIMVLHDRAMITQNFSETLCLGERQHQASSLGATDGML